MSLVLDASALLAFLHDEPGGDQVSAALDGMAPPYRIHDDRGTRPVGQGLPGRHCCIRKSQVGWGAGKTVVRPLFCYRFQRNEYPYVKPDPLNFFGPGGAKPGLPTHCFSPQWPYCGGGMCFRMIWRLPIWTVRVRPSVK